MPVSKIAQLADNLITGQELKHESQVVKHHEMFIIITIFYDDNTDRIILFNPKLRSHIT